MWIKAIIFFPDRLKNILITKKNLIELNLTWAEELNEENYITFLEGVFLYLKKENLVPNDAQLHAIGKLWDRDVVFFTVSSKEFDEVFEGEYIPIKTLELKRKE